MRTPSKSITSISIFILIYVLALFIAYSRKPELLYSIKRLLSQAPVLAKFELRAEHRVTADCSHNALGVALLQRK